MDALAAGDSVEVLEEGPEDALAPEDAVEVLQGALEGAEP